jgi:hypothetical protein
MRRRWWVLGVAVGVVIAAGGALLIERTRSHPKPRVTFVTAYPSGFELFATPAPNLDGGGWLSLVHRRRSGIPEPAGELLHVGAHSSQAVPMPESYLSPDVVVVDGRLVVWVSLLVLENELRAVHPSPAPGTINNQIGWVGADGHLQRRVLPDPLKKIGALAGNPDGGVWYSASASAGDDVYGKITSSVDITTYPNSARARGLFVGRPALAVDGSLWLVALRKTCAVWHIVQDQSGEPGEPVELLPEQSETFPRSCILVAGRDGLTRLVWDYQVATLTPDNRIRKVIGVPVVDGDTREVKGAAADDDAGIWLLVRHCDGQLSVSEVHVLLHLHADGSAERYSGPNAGSVAVSGATDVAAGGGQLQLPGYVTYIAAGLPGQL